MWTTTYDDTGGYDCMTGAWWIKYRGRIVVALDLSEYGQRPCTDDGPARAAAEPVALAIVAALNAAGVTDGRD